MTGTLFVKPEDNETGPVHHTPPYDTGQALAPPQPLCPVDNLTATDKSLEPHPHSPMRTRQRLKYAPTGPKNAQLLNSSSSAPSEAFPLIQVINTAVGTDGNPQFAMVLRP